MTFGVRDIAGGLQHESDESGGGHHAYVEYKREEGDMNELNDAGTDDIRA